MVNDQYPDVTSSERTVRAALVRVLTNISNYPDAVGFRLLGLDLSDVISEATEAVMATGLIGPSKDLDAGSDDLDDLLSRLILAHGEEQQFRLEAFGARDFNPEEETLYLEAFLAIRELMDKEK